MCVCVCVCVYIYIYIYKMNKKKCIKKVLNVITAEQV